MIRMKATNDLADEHDPPRQHGRRPPAEDGADGDARPGDPADDGVGDLAARSLEVAGDQRGEGREDQRRRRCPRGPTSRGPARNTIWEAAVSAEPQA